MKQINGDKINGKINRILYFYQCIINWNKGSVGNINYNYPKLSIDNVNKAKKSSSRILCDAFWNSIDYANLKSQLKNQLNFFDIGCGSGNYGKLYENLSGPFFGSYTGIDIYKHKNFPEKFKFIESSAENISQYINDRVNFITSQSALEHIEKDFYVLEQTTKKLSELNKLFIQVHMLPASKSLWLYLWHGYRQYSKKNLMNIINKLKEKYEINISVVPLGGNYSFWTHLKNITLPIIFHSLKNKKNFKWHNQLNIEKKILNSVKKDLNYKGESPIFWALIISSKNVVLKYKY